MIEDIRIDRLALPLSSPYKLAMGEVTSFDTILVRLVIDGREGLGEATILTGYTPETIETSWARSAGIVLMLAGLGAEAARARIAAELADAPFTLAAFISAIEMAEGAAILAVETPQAVPLLAGINAVDPAGIEREIEAAVAAGYETLKIKVGFDLVADLERLAFIQRCTKGRVRLRVDANQGYSRDQGVRFMSELSPEGIELLEQPCAAADWDAAAAVAKVKSVPLMLDESIYDLEDIRRAASIGADLVKLKLMKMGGLRPLIDGLELIRSLGMQPVLGNGVASDLGCWMESCVARRHVTNAGEMNGFLRQRVPLAAAPMKVAGGHIHLEPGSSLPLDDARIAASRISRVSVAAPVRSQRKAS